MPTLAAETSSESARALASLLAAAMLLLVACGSERHRSDDAGADGALDATPPDAAQDAHSDANDAPDGDVGDGKAAWVLSYFHPAQELADDSLYLAYSVDGLHWTTLGSGPAYQLAGMGSNHIRDPFLFRKNDGTFVYLATDWTLAVNDGDYWNRPSSSIVVADSADLITFTNPRRVTVTNIAGPNGSQMHAWAPEAFYDAERGAYGIIWSGEDDATRRNRLYVSYTADFTHIQNPTPTTFFDPGYAVIDGTILSANGRNYLVFKYANPVEDIQIARSSTSSLAAGGFSTWDPSYIGSSSNTSRVLEGPFILKIPGQSRYYVFADKYTQGGVFAAFTTTNLDADPATWTTLAASSFSFPAGVRHANTVRVTQPELDALIAHYGVPRYARIRSTFVGAGKAFYVAHSWFHALITPLDDGAQLTDDFRFRVVPGLADPNDPALVSFEPAGFPGRYLRIRSATPNDYPACPHGSNRGYELCNEAYVPLADRHHLGWIDAFEDTATYRSDATFRRVPALNGVTSLESLQWYGDGTRYLRHVGYQLFAHTVSGSAVENTDASFTLEME